MSLLFLLLLLLIGPVDHEGLFIHTPPSGRPRLSTLTPSDNEEMLERLSVNLSTLGLIKLLERPIADSEVEKKDQAVLAARVLAERSAKEATRALENLLGDSSLFLRTEAAIALSHLDAGHGRAALKQILQDSSIEPTSPQLMKVVERLAELGDDSGYLLVKRNLEHGTRGIRTVPVRILPRFRKAGIDVIPDLFRALELSLQAMESGDPDERKSGAVAFGWVLWSFNDLEDQRAIVKLREIGPKVSGDLRERVEQTIEQIRRSDTARLIDLLKRVPQNGERTFAAWKLGDKGEKQAIPDLVEALKDEHLELRLEAALALVRLGDERGRTWLQRFFRDSSSGESTAAMYVAGALAELGDASGLALITHVLEQGSWTRRFDAIKVLPVFKQAKVDPVPPLLRALELADKAIQSREADVLPMAKAAARLVLEYLQRLGDARVLPKVQELSQSDDAELRATTEKTLRQLRKQAEVR